MSENRENHSDRAVHAGILNAPFIAKEKQASDAVSSSSLVALQNKENLIVQSNFIISC